VPHDFRPDSYRELSGPVDGRDLSYQDETVKRYQVQIDGSEVKCRDEIVSVNSKKRGTSAMVGSAKDAVQGDETVRVPENFINGKEFKLIDLGYDYKAVPGCEGT
jgi:hypothetical protein